MQFFYSFLFSLVATAILFPPVIYFLKRLDNYDIPNSRSSHSVPTPRSGGVVVVFVSVVDYALFDFRAPYFVFVMIPFAILGLVDDFKKLGPKFRLMLLTLFAIAEVCFAASNFNLIVGLISVVFIVGFVNAWNFMDGINGLSAFSSILIGTTWWILGEFGSLPVVKYVSVILVGVGIAFALFNAFKPMVFLGDVGAYGLGAFVSGTVVYAFYLKPYIAILMLFALIPAMFDTTFTLLRRLLKRERLLESHRDHIYQQLIDLGYSHIKVSLMYSTFIVFCGIVSVIVMKIGHLYYFLGLFGCLVLGIAYLYLPRLASNGNWLK